MGDNILLNFQKIKVANISGDQLLCLCPFHNDTKPSLSISLEKNLAYCFAGCFSGEAIELVTRLLKCNRLIARELLDTGEIFDIDFYSYIKNTSPVVISGNGKNSSDSFAWFRDRGFTLGTIIAWSISFEPNRVKLPVPSTSYSIYRNIGFDPKYQYEPGFPKSSLLFGKDITQCEKVYIVEGPLDCIYLWQFGIPSLAILGSDMSQKQADILNRSNKLVVLLLDNDEAGSRGVVKALRKLKEASFLKLPEGVKDVCELSESQRIIIFKGGNRKCQC